MRGDGGQQLGVFSYVSAEDRISKDHPLRAIRRMTDQALAGLSRHFDTLYAASGRPSIAPERLLRALLLQALYSVRSERQLMEQLEYNLLFRWFVGLNMDDRVWDVTVFTKNRERLMRGDVGERLLLAVVDQAHAERLLSEEHFTVDGTLIQAWVNRRSFKEKKDPPSRGTGVGGKKLLRDTHESSTDAQARLYKKATAAFAVPSYLGHVLTENRNGLVVDVRVTQATGTAERDAAAEMLKGKPASKPATLGADRGYDTAGFVRQMREMKVTPHVAQNDSHRRSAVDARTTRHEGYAISQRKRKRVEEVFGWMKTVALQRKTRFLGPDRTGWMFTLAAAAYNLVRMRNLQAATA
jgi:transposase